MLQDVSAPEQTRPDRYGPSPGRRRLPRWVTVVLALLAVVVVGVLAAVGLLVWAISGGWDGLRGTAQPDDRPVVAARERSRGELDTVTARAVRSVAGRELARIRFDSCAHGQNNWKVHDGYTLRCELADSVVLAPDAADVTAAAAQIDEALQRDGWRSTGIRNEMTLPNDPNLSYLRSTRSGHYQQLDDERRQLDVGVTVLADSPVTRDLPYDPSVDVVGDVAAYREALRGGAGAQPGAREPRVVVHSVVRYFEDD